MAFEFMDKTFTHARRTKPHLIKQSSFTLAGREVEMHIVGPKLAEKIGLPFSHLQVEGNGLNRQDLIIQLWDETETEIPCAIASRQDSHQLRPVFFRSADSRYIFQQLQYSVVCFDRPGRRIIVCTTSAEKLSLYELGRPLHVPLSVWHNDQGAPVIHSGLVSKKGRGVLFAGAAGAGKSTSALVCAHHGFGYVSDDLIGLEALPDGSFIGHGIYNSTFLESDHLERFALLKPHAVRGRYEYEDKLLVLLSNIPSLRLERSAKIEAIALPRVVSARSSKTRPASKGQALLALMPSFRVGWFGTTACGFDKLSRLAESLPCYWLDIGSDFEEIPCTVEDLLIRVSETG
jgi:hypothetical protein